MLLLLEAVIWGLDVVGGQSGTFSGLDVHVDIL